MLIGEIGQETTNRFKNNEDLETYINAIDVDFDSEDVFLQDGCMKKTSEFNEVNRLENGRSTDFKQDIVENTGKNCYIHTSGNCFIECINPLTGRVYIIEFLTFIRDERKTSQVKISSRIRPFCKKYNINIRCYDGFRVCLRTIREKNVALYMYKYHFSLFWKSRRVSFNKAIEEIKLNPKIVDKIISEELDKSFIKNE